MGLAIAQKSTTEQSPLQDQNQAHVEPRMGEAADQRGADHHKARRDQEKSEARGIGKEECQGRAGKSHEKKDRQGAGIGRQDQEGARAWWSRAFAASSSE